MHCCKELLERSMYETKLKDSLRFMASVVDKAGVEAMTLYTCNMLHMISMQVALRTIVDGLMQPRKHNLSLSKWRRSNFRLLMSNAIIGFEMAAWINRYDH